MRIKSATLVAFLFLGSIIVQMVTPMLALAATPSSVVISELSMGSATSATEEFLELYNNSSSPMSMANWSIYYRPATGTTYSKRATFSATASVQAHSFYLVSTNSPNDVVLISGMSQSSGVIELRDAQGVVMDRVGYGGTTLANGKAAAAPEAGQSLYRQYDLGTNTMNNTGDNFTDFYIATTPTPKTIPSIEVEQQEENIDYPALTISELYPNPTDEQSESTDEFIEIYNPNTFDIDLSGWLLRDSAGNTFIVKNRSIPAGGHLVFMSAETHLSLNNTGDTITLLNPAGELVDLSADYGESKEGLSWGLVGGAWDWNATPTPSTTNSAVYVSPVVVKPVANKAIKTTSAKKKAAIVKKAATKKPKASKLSSSKNSSSNASNSGDIPSGMQSSFANIWPWLLIVLGTATIGYGIYEYRPELTTAYHQLKNKLGAGR